jgi:hypothetical protein
MTITETDRSQERTQCLADILISAVEDGCLNSWRRVSNYGYTLADPDDACSPTLDASVMVWEDADDDGTFSKDHAATLDTIATGLGRIERGEVGCNAEIREAVEQAQRHNDASYFDAYSADAVLQAGLFGELIYG